MANYGYMTLTGKIQGLISAKCSTQDSIGNHYQSNHTDEIMVLSYNHTMSNIENNNGATHNPIIITKNVDKASPLLARALSSREEINGTIKFYRVSSSGTQEKFFSVIIKGGIIADLTHEMPQVILLSDTQFQEHIAIRYQEITWTHHLAGTSGYSFWGQESEA